MDIREINRHFGNIDLHLLDQILKGRFDKSMKILDTGCGEGRNLVYFLREGYDVYGIDRDPGGIRMLHYTSRSLNPEYDTGRFIKGQIEQLPYEDDSFDAVICTSVLHFAENADQFFKMFDELLRVLRNTGFLFLQMTSNIGWTGQLRPLKDGKYQMPDASVRFVLTEKIVQKLLDNFHLKLLEPLRTVIIGNSSCSNPNDLNQSDGERQHSCSSILLLGAR